MSLYVDKNNDYINTLNLIINLDDQHILTDQIGKDNAHATQEQVSWLTHVICFLGRIFCCGDSLAHIRKEKVLAATKEFFDSHQDQICENRELTEQVKNKLWMLYRDEKDNDAIASVCCSINSAKPQWQYYLDHKPDEQNARALQDQFDAMVADGNKKGLELLQCCAEAQVKNYTYWRIYELQKWDERARAGYRGQFNYPEWEFAYPAPEYHTEPEKNGYMKLALYHLEKGDRKSATENFTKGFRDLFFHDAQALRERAPKNISFADYKTIILNALDNALQHDFMLYREVGENKTESIWDSYAKFALERLKTEISGWN